MRTRERVRQTGAGGSRRAALTLALTAAALASSAGPAAAHGGDTSKIHSCIVPASGYAQIVGPGDTCSKNYQPLDWAAVDTNTPYSAGSGLSLTDNVFSVTGAPWSGLTGVPAGFADGEDDLGDVWDDLSGVPAGFADGDDDVGDVWDDLSGVPAGFADGDDDDGSAGLVQLKSQIATDDGAPNESDDLVSFTKIKDLESAAGGRILGSFIQNGTIEGLDIANGAITAAQLAGTYSGSTQTIPGAVTSEKIFDGTIAGRDLGQVVTVVTDGIDPLPVLAQTRAAVTLPVAGVRTDDLVTVSPPADLEQGLVFAGSDVLQDGVVTIYLHNATAESIDGWTRTWRIRYLDSDG